MTTIIINALSIYGHGYTLFKHLKQQGCFIKSFQIEAMSENLHCSGFKGVLLSHVVTVSSPNSKELIVPHGIKLKLLPKKGEYVCMYIYSPE